jgi:hypothetical protein
MHALLATVGVWVALGAGVVEAGAGEPAGDLGDLLDNEDSHRTDAIVTVVVIAVGLLFDRLVHLVNGGLGDFAGQFHRLFTAVDHLARGGIDLYPELGVCAHGVGWKTRFG